MTGLVSKAILLTVCGMVIGGAALAGQPNASTSSKPACIGLVGSNGTVADPRGQFTITVRDLANNTIANSNVKINFTNCADINIGIGTSQLGCPGCTAMTVDCTNHIISALTNASGVVTLRIIGSTDGTYPPGITAKGGALPKSVAGCATVSADNFALGTVTLNAYDLNGAGGVTGTDESVWLDHFFCTGNPYYGRCDYDCSGAVGGGDLSVWLDLFLVPGGGSTTGATTECASGIATGGCP